MFDADAKNRQFAVLQQVFSKKSRICLFNFLKKIFSKALVVNNLDCLCLLIQEV